MAIKANLIIDQGANFTTTITVTDNDGLPVDLTDYTGAAQMRKHYTSSTSTAFTVALGGATGTVSLSMTANASANLTAGRYVYDVELTNNGSGIVSRIVEGIVTVTPNVTR
jgi:hypothetical protein